MNVFEIVIWAGAALTLAGLAALIWCILTVARAGLDDQALRIKMRGVIAVNMGALAASTIGLMLVVVGILLGK